MSSHPNPLIDPVAAQAWLDSPKRALSTPAQTWLMDEVAQRLAEHLQVIRLQPESWLHWRPARSGVQGQALLRARYPQASVLSGPLPAGVGPGAGQASSSALPPKARAVGWLRRAWQRWRGLSAAKGESAPDRAHDRARMHDTLTQSWPTDLVWSNLTLHHECDPGLVMKTWLERLKPGGVVLFSCFGPDTLQELRELYLQKGWPPPMHPMTDMHDWGDLLVQSGFSEPVMDMERLTLHYQEVDTLLQELRCLGANLHPERVAHVRTRAWLGELTSALQSLARPSEGLGVPLTFEVIYGHAFKPHLAAPQMAVQAQTEITLEAMREQLLARKKP